MRLFLDLKALFLLTLLSMDHLRARLGNNHFFDSRLRIECDFEVSRICHSY